jgi:16S rRNA (guanine527-N7)-methyltransferase
LLAEISVPLVKKDFYFIPMKAKLDEEISKINVLETKLNIKLEEKKEFELPFEGSKRTILKFKKIKETDKIYPRSFSKMKNSSL